MLCYVMLCYVMLCYVMLCSNHIYVNLSHAIIKEYSQSESKKFAASIAVM